MWRREEMHKKGICYGTEAKCSGIDLQSKLSSMVAEVMPTTGLVKDQGIRVSNSQFVRETSRQSVQSVSNRDRLSMMRDRNERRLGLGGTSEAWAPERLWGQSSQDQSTRQPERNSQLQLVQEETEQIWSRLPDMTFSLYLGP